MAVSPGLMLAFSIGGQVLGAVQQQQAMSAQIKAERQAQAFRDKQTSLQISREETELALRSAENERRLRQQLASQRAAFAGAGVEAGSGSALRLQEATIGTINRQQGLDTFATSQNILNLNVQNEQDRIGSQATIGAIKTKKSTALWNAVTDIGQSYMNNKDLL